MSAERVSTSTIDQNVELVTSAEERIDFLKQSFAFNESTIRAYDTKSQIALAAFVLSMNPLWSILNRPAPTSPRDPL